MLITISGPDGTGKTTQAKKLLNYFNEKGFRITSITNIVENFNYESGEKLELNKFYEYFKQYDVIHTRFRLHSKENARVMDELEVTPIGNFKLATMSAYTSYYDYIQWHQYVNYPLLKDNKILICDKYAFDDIAYKATFGCQYDWMKKLFYNVIQPDIGFYIDVDPETIIERNINRPDGRIVFYDNERNVRRLQYYYNRIVNDYKIIKLNGNLAPETIHKQVIDSLSDKFSI